MFNLNDTMRYFLCPGRTDMRKGISSLCGVVHEKMNSEVKNGECLHLIGSSRRLMKLLHAEDGGNGDVCKTPGGGPLQTAGVRSPIKQLSHGMRDLVMMVEGIQGNPQQRLRA